MVLTALVRKNTHIKCFAHTLNLSWQQECNLPAVSRLLGRVWRISTLHQCSSTTTNHLQVKQKLLDLQSHELKSDVATRWTRDIVKGCFFFSLQLMPLCRLLRWEKKSPNLALSKELCFKYRGCYKGLKANKRCHYIDVRGEKSNRLSYYSTKCTTSDRQHWRLSSF